MGSMEHSQQWTLTRPHDVGTTRNLLQARRKRPQREGAVESLEELGKEFGGFKEGKKRVFRAGQTIRPKPPSSTSCSSRQQSNRAVAEKTSFCFFSPPEPPK